MSAGTVAFCWVFGLMAAGMLLLPAEKHPERKRNGLRLVFGSLLLVAAGTVMGRSFMVPW
jgi:nitric oxide reductase large subunit